MTALLLLPLVGCLIYLPSPSLFSWIVGLLVVFAAWEWASMTRLNVYIYTASLAFSLIILKLWVFKAYAVNGIFLVPGLLWWVYAGCCVLRYPRWQASWGKHRWFYGFHGLVMLLTAWISWVALRLEFGTQALVLLLLMVWAADTGAYFAGKFWGRIRLVPEISPGKTWEGIYGGAAGTFGVALTWVLLFHADGVMVGRMAVFAGVIFIFSVLGDLVESMVKRQNDRKDSGHWLPGHGGLLDRIDSMLAASPWFFVGIGWVLRGQL